MRKKLLGTMMCAALTASLLAGCSGKAAETTTAAETTAAGETEAAKDGEKRIPETHRWIIQETRTKLATTSC